MSNSPSSSFTQKPEQPVHDVYFFCTCLIDLFVPEAGLDAVRLLEHAGVRVHFPEAQTCCGQPAYTSGQPDEARHVARQQLGLFPEPWPIILPSGSCAGMMRHHYTALFTDTVDMSRAESVASRVWELSEFLVEVLGVKLNDQGAPIRIALHTSCSARRETGGLKASRALLGQLEQVTLEIQDHESECCGFGGMFSVRHPEISGGIVRDKVASLRACGAETLVTGDCGCMLNITGHAAKTGMPIHGQHLASFLLARVLGVPSVLPPASNQSRDSKAGV
jgi:L-lactate dehydrogenase complex protein LldE